MKKSFERHEMFSRCSCLNQNQTGDARRQVCSCLSATQEAFISVTRPLGSLVLNQGSGELQLIVVDGIVQI
jgi:hypothetical protein